MSYSSEHVLAKGTRIADVREFIELLSYRRQGVLRYEGQAYEEYYFFDDLDYHSWSGVELSLHQREDRRVVVSTRSAVGRSFYDLAHQNYTIFNLRKRFGGDFETDEGRNRYQRSATGPTSPAASGCHLAFNRFGTNLIKAAYYHSSRQFAREMLMPSPRFKAMLDFDPRALANNALVPYLVATLEDYFKSSFVAILRYSPRK
ncbi:MAG TPA: hypothetical protein VF713_15430, partial [Thermoanaerobaculia bacterium]